MLLLLPLLLLPLLLLFEVDFKWQCCSSLLLRNGGKIGKVVDVRLFIVYEMVWRHSNGCVEARELTMCGNVMGQLVEIFDRWSTMTLNETKKPGAAVGMMMKEKNKSYENDTQ